MANGNLAITDETKVVLPMKKLWAVLGLVLVGGTVWVVSVNYRLAAIEKKLDEINGFVLYQRVPAKDPSK